MSVVMRSGNSSLIWSRAEALSGVLTTVQFKCSNSLHRSSAVGSSSSTTTALCDALWAITNQSRLGPQWGPVKRENEGKLAELLDFVELDAQLLELLWVHRRGGVGHQALGLLRFGEGDHVADGVGPTQQHNQAVQAERDAAVRRGAVLQRVQQKPEFGLRFVLADPKQIKELALNLPAVVADAAPADFGPVQDEIVGLGARLQRLGFELRHVLIQPRGEGVMQGDVALLRLVRVQTGEVRHPKPPSR